MPTSTRSPRHGGRGGWSRARSTGVPGRRSARPPTARSRRSTSSPPPRGSRRYRHSSAKAAIDSRLEMRIAGVLGTDAGRLDADAPLTTLGLDSLLAVRIRNAVQHDFDVLLPPSLLLRGASINDVRSWLGDALALEEAPPAAQTRAVPGAARTPEAARIPIARVAPRDASERMVHAVWAEVLRKSGFGVTETFTELG